ncbi:hypothetical protein [Paenirhodobacter populi]|uniref:Uncharacterized protein n=1 Tax=Paenirhodobacter populi TaxID=2306993 RepID=A0A443IJV3_9RHOB|nr:hypothetical protein [Sinirhodobacter populi]RWR04482.1 hypothetical protein D2T33_21005 [Sinirhodobacter populi]
MSDYRNVPLSPVFVAGKEVRPAGRFTPPESWKQDGGEAPDPDAMKASQRAWESRWRGMKIRADERT